MTPSYSKPPYVRVVIPARNEARTIESALDALRSQVDLSGQPLDPTCYDVTVLANNCTSHTANVVHDYADRHRSFQLRVEETHFPPERANIGNARRMIFDEACARFEAEGIDGLVASTDADTSVAPDWIAATRAEFANGADAVGGRIVLSPVELERMEPRVRSMHLRDTGYRILLANLEALIDPKPWNPAPTHHQHFGASFAVRVSTYRRAGGIPEVGALEDMAFHERLKAIDARVRRSPRVRVLTSARRDGRVPIGLSTQLEEWARAAAEGIPQTEEPAARSLKRMELIHDWRCAWQHHGPFQGLSTFGSYLKSIEKNIEDAVQQAVPFQPAALEQVIHELRLEWERRSKRSSR